MDAETIIKLTTNLGLPTSLLVAFVWLLYHTINRILREPSATNANDKGGIGYQLATHSMQTTEAIRKNTEATLQVVEKVSEVLTETHSAVRDIHSRGCHLAVARGASIDGKPPATG